MMNVLYVIVGLVTLTGAVLLFLGVIAALRAVIRRMRWDELVTPGDLILYVLMLVSVVFISWALGSVLVGGGS